MKENNYISGFKDGIWTTLGIILLFMLLLGWVLWLSNLGDVPICPDPGNWVIQ